MSAEPVVHRRGALEITHYDRSKHRVRLVSCPFCGHDFGEKERRWSHFLEEHGPEGAGLSPRGETPDVDERDEEWA